MHLINHDRLYVREYRKVSRSFTMVVNRMQRLYLTVKVSEEDTLFTWIYHRVVIRTLDQLSSLSHWRRLRNRIDDYR